MNSPVPADVTQAQQQDIKHLDAFRVRQAVGVDPRQPGQRHPGSQPDVGRRVESRSHRLAGDAVAVRRLPDHGAPRHPVAVFGVGAPVRADRAVKRYDAGTTKTAIPALLVAAVCC
jgi:hypothetical protein